MTAPFTVALDGPAAAGKGTIAKAIAEAFGFAHLDTGLLYRAVAARVLSGEDAADAAATLTQTELDSRALRTPEIAQKASQIAALPEVRAALRQFQRAFARRAGGAVLDGRDIGTVICPEAEVKLFVTASPEVRARRRYEELLGRSIAAEYAEVLADVQNRDERDMNRADAPLRPAEDAVTLDTSELSISSACKKAISLVATAL